MPCESVAFTSKWSGALLDQVLSMACFAFMTQPDEDPGRLAIVGRCPFFQVHKPNIAPSMDPSLSLGTPTRRRSHCASSAGHDLHARRAVAAADCVDACCCCSSSDDVKMLPLWREDSACGVAPEFTKAFAVAGAHDSNMPSLGCVLCHRCLWLSVFPGRHQAGQTPSANTRHTQLVLGGN